MTFRALLSPTLAILILVLGACSDTGSNDEEGADASGSEATVELHAEHHEEGIVEMSSEKIATAGIETSTVVIASLPNQLSTTGQVAFDQNRLAHVSPRIPGRVHEVRARLGQEVRKGEILATLDSIELGRAKAEYLQSRARDQLARENLEREEDLYSDRISSQREMLEARAAQIEAEAALRNVEETLRLYGLSNEEIADVTYESPGQSLFSVRAPLSGKVIEKHLTVGELVEPEEVLFSLADFSEVWIWIDVYERDLRQVHLEDRADIRVDAYPDYEFGGHVSYLSDQVDLDTRRVRARIDVENPGGRLRAGMFAKVELKDPHQGDTGEQPPAPVVPQSALHRDGDEAVVFVELAEGRFQRRKVRTGRVSDGLVEILDGLAEGETIVSQGGFFIKSEFARDELGEGHGH